MSGFYFLKHMSTIALNIYVYIRASICIYIGCFHFWLSSHSSFKCWDNINLWHFTCFSRMGSYLFTPFDLIRIDTSLNLTQKTEKKFLIILEIYVSIPYPLTYQYSSTIVLELYLLWWAQLLSQHPRLYFVFI